jgi:hypothetical protein
VSDLTPIEKRKLERALGMGSGYVLGFSNRTFDDFFFENFGINIYHDKYSYGGGSKANRMRAFWESEDNTLVGKVLDLLFTEWQEFKGWGSPEQPPEECTPIIRRLQNTAMVQDARTTMTGRSESIEQPVPKRRLRIFLCHSSEDKPAVRSLYSRLRSENFEPWLDEESLVGGQDWELEISRAVRNADIVLVCLSQESVNKSGFVQREIKSALDVADEQPEGRIFIIPLRLDQSDVPERLRRWHWVNYFDRDGHAKLLRALYKRATEIGIGDLIQEAHT